VMLDEELNAAIDEVARQMTDAAPREGAGFRRRVIARIEAEEAPRTSWRAAFVLAPIAVAMAIVIAIVAARRPGPAGPAGAKGPALQAGTKSTVAAYGPTAGDPARPNGPAPETGAEPGPQRPDLPTLAQTAAGTVHGPGPIGPGVQAPNGSAPAIAVLNLSPLTVDSIALSPIETDSMPLQKLDAIAPIGVTPLGSPSEGDQP
jgi:hypothetical protein